MATTVKVIKDQCISCQLCADTLPQVFRMDDDGLAEVHDSAGADRDAIQEMIDACPAACIVWDES